MCDRSFCLIIQHASKMEELSFGASRINTDPRLKIINKYDPDNQNHENVTILKRQNPLIFPRLLRKI